MKRKGGGASKMKAVGDRVSLNPEREADDQREAELILQEASLREALESVWCSVLHSGEALRRQRCDVSRFRQFAEASGFATTDRQMNVAIRNFDMQTEDDDKLTFDGFVKVLFYLGTERFSLPVTERSTAIRKMLETFLTAYVERYRKANVHDGGGPDDVILAIPEIDRLLYVYDTVFDRLFQRYREMDQHQTRELTLEQVKILDNFVEMEEMKEMMKDFGIFPKLLSFVELSKACQWSCFGKVQIDPTKQGPGKGSNIEVVKKDGGQVGANIAADVTNVVVSGDVASNPLYIPALPPEFQANEVLLDKPRFMMCLLRIAQMMFSRPEHTKTLPSIISRAEELLSFMAPVYERMFGRTMESDCDYSEKGAPLLNNVSPSAALVPDHGPMHGGFEIQVIGTNFCEKRGVYVRFGSDGRVIVRAKSIQKKKVIVDAPQMEARDVEVDVDFHHGEYLVYIQKIVKVAVECSNNRWQYSETDPTQYFVFRDVPREFTINAEQSALLMKLFGAVCSADEKSGSHNSKVMSRAKWRGFKSLAGLTEALKSSHPTSSSTTPRNTSQPPSEKGQLMEIPEDRDAFFLEVAEYQAEELALTFKGFLRVLSRTLYEMYSEDEWVNHVDEIANIQLDVQRRTVVSGPILEQNELVLARRAIAMVERRSVLELDVFLGPVLCGVLRSRRGDVTSSYSGSPVILVRSHPFLAYDQMEMNTETSIMRHLQLSQSIAHFLSRLRKDGFDFAAHHPKPTTRRPAGRCWSIAQGERLIGAMWDYEGNYSCLEWQPADKELYHPKITMSVYEEEKSAMFIICFLHFSKAKDVQQLRQTLESKGFTLQTKLYKLPM